MAEYIEFDKDHHAHHHKETFITKYIFSQDHKMIAKQYLFTGVFFMGIIGILMSALMRMQIAWPEEPNIFFDFLLGKWAPNAVYVLQAIGIDGNVIDSKPIEFGDDISIDEFDLALGSYNLHLVDNRGHFTKTILLVR